MIVSIPEGVTEGEAEHMWHMVRAMVSTCVMVLAHVLVLARVLVLACVMVSAHVTLSA